MSTISSCIVVLDNVLIWTLHKILFGAGDVLVMYRTVSSGTSISLISCFRVERHTFAKCQILPHDLFRAGHCLEFAK